HYRLHRRLAFISEIPLLAGRDLVGSRIQTFNQKMRVVVSTSESGSAAFTKHDQCPGDKLSAGCAYDCALNLRLGGLSIRRLACRKSGHQEKCARKPPMSHTIQPQRGA